MIVNKYEIPEEFMGLIKAQKPGLDIDRKIIRTTTLIGSPQKAIFEVRFKDKIEVDVTETFNMLFGIGIHHLLEEENKDKLGVRSELALEKDFNGWEITGTLDYIGYQDGYYTIKDYKVTSAWTIVYQNYNKYIAQLNVYNWLTGMKASKLVIDAIMRDWVKSKSKREKDYPKTQFAQIEIPIWSNTEVETYIIKQLERFEKLIAKTDNELLNNVWCNEEERMSRPTKYAVMKNSNKTATALFNTLDEAMLYLERLQVSDKKNTYKIEERKGENMCLEYCPVRHVCGLSKGAKIMEEL